MKITNLNSKSYKQLKSGSSDNNAKQQGITRRLLEKYKPKVHYNVKNISEKNNYKKVA
tara:strand:- start:39 stop:212 length:174 start_codon:yes stop_codon:yes gene_type:complete